MLLAQRWILACLRNRRFFSLEELNAAIWELLERLNARPFQKLEGCRRSAFETLDRPAMKPLPAQRYEMGAWKLGVGVNVDHHFEYDHHHYSVPCALIGAKVDVRATATVIEVWRDNARVTSHERSYGPKGTAVTKPEHRPRAHREWGEWPAERLVGWAQTKGSKTGEVAAAILARGPHPESGRRACLGLMRMGERYGEARLEAACGRALAIGNPTLRSVQAILKSGLEKVALVEEVEARSVVHENIRGGGYFDREEVEATSEEATTKRSEGAETEARYLEEERQSIIHEPRVDASGAPSRSAPTREPLPTLLARAQALLSGPRVVKQIGRRETDAQGGGDARPGGDVGSSCTIQSACITAAGNEGEPLGEDEEGTYRDSTCDAVMCESDEPREGPDEPRRGEV